MKSVSSSLNPYAASYSPLSRRGADHATITFENERTKKDLKSPEVPFSEAPFRSYATVTSVSTSRHAINFRDKQTLDEELQMNSGFLPMTYPGFSYQSLTAVYQENKEDLEATVDMLNQLERMFRFEETTNVEGLVIAEKQRPFLRKRFLGTSGNGFISKSYLDESLDLPETLDIGDVTDAPGDSKRKNAKGERAASSSGNSAAAL